MTTLIAAAHLAHLIVTPQKPVSKVTFGKYQAELCIPEGGLFAQEQTDVEFRVVDTTQKDQVEEGFKGVGGIDATGTITMPSMAGMPMLKPDIHREGVPGDYGMVLFFGHGGEYQIDLNLKIPGDSPKHITFLVDVMDERPVSSKTVQPFHLGLVQTGKQAKAGQPTNMVLQVVETKTNHVQTGFDTAHERKFHLLLVSKDLNWFRHEHPIMKPNGNWVISQMFPAGGEYWVYGDVAPSGKGSRILATKIRVAGPKPTWNTKLILSSTGSDQGLSGILSTNGPIAVGQSTEVTIKLTDSKTKTSTGIADTFLGAVGHLMIFSQDGLSVVHSHPFETTKDLNEAKKGTVRFNARFPKSGLYKAYAQFMWHGSVKTLGFTVKVKK
jgi:hypothetical protein